MVINTAMSCCGVRELHNLRWHKNPKVAMKDFCREIRPLKSRYSPDFPPRPRDKFRYAIFTSHRKGKYGLAFANYITEQKLGKVISTGDNINPNTRNSVNVWVWTVNHERLSKWKAVHMKGEAEIAND